MVRETADVSSSEPLSEEQYALWWNQAGFAELRQVLFWRWDPIGIDDAFPATADEYDTYVRVLLSRLQAGMTASDIATYLLEVEQSSMGRRYSEDAKLRQVGERVITWFEESISHWMDHSPDFA